jgi:anhydro-N-acetylmuramic acid kinase
MSLPVPSANSQASERLAQKILAGECVVAGVLSGTSADGIDVVLFRPRPVAGGQFEWNPIAFETLPFAVDLAAEVRHVLDGGAIDLARLAHLNRDLGEAFGRAIKQVADGCGETVDLVGSHGQTVWHHDGVGERGRASLQLGDGDFVAEVSGAAVVSDFRQRDLAAGGEGAPIGHLVDPWLFPKLPLPGAILNLGGFGNLTLLGDAGVLASFDTGPAGALLDGISRTCLGQEMDSGGEQAARGTCCEQLFAQWMGELEPFLSTPPPRSTGRDSFGALWVQSLLQRANGTPPCDLLATGVAVVAATVARSLADLTLCDLPTELVVAGGGARNPELLRAIAKATSLPVVSSACHGVAPDEREALVFGLLAVAHVLEIPLPVKNDSVRTPTGAKLGRLLGKLSPAPLVEIG